MLTFAQSGRVDANCPGPRPKPLLPFTPTVSIIPIRGIGGCCKVGSINKAEVIAAFCSSRIYYKAGEPDSDLSQDSDSTSNRGSYKKKIC
jgi:hypothetical protein